jgi:hypothetical protein
LASPWIAYNDLAWTEDWLADPSKTEETFQNNNFAYSGEKDGLFGDYPLTIFVGQKA